jgi:hypothetical protein
MRCRSPHTSESRTSKILLRNDQYSVARGPSQSREDVVVNMALIQILNFAQTRLKDIE